MYLKVIQTSTSIAIQNLKLFLNINGNQLTEEKKHSYFLNMS